MFPSTEEKIVISETRIKAHGYVAKKNVQLIKQL